ncbi:MAG: hypothetical protein O9301_14140 [Leptospira sp.]|nr:hypothetical protein [Leptospira sp.]
MKSVLRKLAALALVVAVGNPFDSDPFASSIPSDSNFQNLKTFHSRIVPPKEDKTLEPPDICSIEENATLSRSRADFLDFFTTENNDQLISDIVFTSSYLISDRRFSPNLLSSLLLNLPPPHSFN